MIQIFFIGVMVGIIIAYFIGEEEDFHWYHEKNKDLYE